MKGKRKSRKEGKWLEKKEVTKRSKKRKKSKDRRR